MSDACNYVYSVFHESLILCLPAWDLEFRSRQMTDTGSQVVDSRTRAGPGQPEPHRRTLSGVGQGFQLLQNPDVSYQEM